MLYIIWYKKEEVRVGLALPVMKKPRTLPKGKLNTKIQHCRIPNNGIPPFQEL
jgi:hypothetical protein